MKTKTPPAPKKLSEAIDLALEDLEIVEKSKDYEVDMNFWHGPTGIHDDPDSVCRVCFAGAVMAVTHQVPWSQKEYPDFSKQNSWPRVFFALDNIRDGRLTNALRDFNHHKSGCWSEGFADRAEMDPHPHNYGSLSVEDYSVDSEKFKSDMRKISKQLKKEEL